MSGNPHILRNETEKGPIAIALAPDRASKSTFDLLANTDIIGGSWMSTHYATELLRVDPNAPLEEGCLAVIRFNGGNAFMMRYETCGHDGNGRFCKRGSHDEMVHFGPIYMARKEINDELVKLVGRVVGCNREFPRPPPATYESPPPRPRKGVRALAGTAVRP
ncbi:MAG: hypothetical protein WBA44_14880 [Mesorhizobium sp.]